MCFRKLTVSCTQVNAIEHDALQVLSLVRSLKNTFALANKIPLDVLIMIPGYWGDSDRDQNLIALSHVCRGWREIFTSCPSLWARLDCTNVEKTRVYIERSRSFPLEVHIGDSLEESSHLVVPHIGRLKTLYVYTTTTSFSPVLVRHFSCRLPLLEKLSIVSVWHYLPPLPDELFEGDLSSLRELSLDGVLPPLPRKDMSNLTTLTLRCMPKVKSLLTQLLNFFESAPRIRYIHLYDSILGSSDAPAERVVSLPRLKKLKIVARPEHSTLLNHLSIPAGASLTLEFSFSGNESPIQSYLPKSSDSLLNLSHITTVSLCFGPDRRFLRLHGPSGELRVLGNWERGENVTHAGVNQFLQSLGRFDLSGCRWLAIQWCSIEPHSTSSIVGCAVYKTLNSLEDLCSLTLIQCSNLLFILTLTPNTNPSTIVLCPKLKEITLYIEGPDDLQVDELLQMAEERASRGAKLSVITIVSTGTLPPKKDVHQLRKQVSRVECKFDDAPPEWDKLPGQVV